VAFPLAVSNKVFTALRLKSTVWQAFLQNKALTLDDFYDEKK
jgi:hypothetical protein